MTAAIAAVRVTGDTTAAGEESSVLRVLDSRVVAVMLACWSGASSCVISDCFRFCLALCCRDDPASESRLEERVDR